MTRRHVQRSPDLRVAIRMQRPENACQPALPGIGWWDPDAHTWTRQTEVMLVNAGSGEVEPPCVIGRLEHAGEDVTWTFTWNGEPWDPSDDTAGAPGVTVAGSSICAYRPPDLWSAISGTLAATARAGGRTFGPIYLVVTSAYY